MALAIALSACSSAPRGRGVGHPAGPARHAYANPGAIVAAELAFARSLRQEEFRKTLKDHAAPNAVLFATDRIDANDYAGGDAATVLAAERTPHAVWVSCNGAQAIVHGAWHLAEASGAYVTIWERQEKGGYKWILSRQASLSTMPPAPEMLPARVAKCSQKPGPRAGERSADSGGAAHRRGNGEGLRWRWEDTPGGNAIFAAEMWNGDAYEPILKQEFGASEKR